MARPFGMTPGTPLRDTAPDNATVKTHTLAKGTAAFFITVETTNARVTFDGSDPSVGSAPSHVIPKDQQPLYFPVAYPAVVKWVSTDVTASVVQLSPLI